MKKISIKNTFFINTLIILITGFIIKFLGLINRIFITRLLGPSGMNLYILSFPTIMLFISISGFSLNISISKLVSESIKTKQYSPKLILYNAIKLSLLISIITIIIFIIILKPLVNVFLKNGDLYLPLLSTILLIPLVGISDSLKGYFNGLKLMKYSSLSSLIEQIFRIGFSIIVLYITIPYGITIACFACLVSLSIGEIASIIYSSIIIKKLKLIHYENTSNEINALIKISIPSTMSKLLGSFTYFLEPIVYLWVLSVLKYPDKLVQEQYTIINAYTLSLLTLGSFVSVALSTTVVPSISENFAVKEFNKVNYYIKKTIIYSLIPGIFITVILLFYPYELMNLIYGSSEGVTEVRKFAVFFLPYYLQAPLSSIYQALGKSKSLFIYSTIFNILRILLIILLSFIPSININSLIIAIFITLDLYFIILYLKIKKLTSFKISFHNSINIFIISLFLISLTILFISIKLNYILSIIILFTIYLILCYKFNLIDINLKNIIKK